MRVNDCPRPNHGDLDDCDVEMMVETLMGWLEAQIPFLAIDKYNSTILPCKS